MTETTTRNEAAERLLAAGYWEQNAAERFRLLDEALAAERRATVERIRERLLREVDDAVWAEATDRVFERILDEEAAR
jgi:hypothetical protein